MNELILNVKKEGVGCYIGAEFYGILVYADDILLLAPSLTALQKMLNICTAFGKSTGLEYNCKKTICIDFHGKQMCTDSSNYSVFLNSQKLMWTDTVEHLGHTLTCCLKWDKDINIKKGQFITCVNNILSEFSFTSPVVKTQLLSTYGTSFYGSPLWDLYGDAANKLNTTWNIAIRRIFNLPYRTHRRFLGIISGLRNVTICLKLRFINFINKMLDSKNSLIRNLLNYTLCSNLSLTGLNLNRILSEFDICSPVSYSLFYKSARHLVLSAYEYKTQLTTNEMARCSVICDMISCIYKNQNCGLTNDECLFIVNDLCVL